MNFINLYKKKKKRYQFILLSTLTKVKNNFSTVYINIGADNGELINHEKFSSTAAKHLLVPASETGVLLCLLFL